MSRQNLLTPITRYVGSTNARHAETCLLYIREMGRCAIAESSSSCGTLGSFLERGERCCCCCKLVLREGKNCRVKTQVKVWSWHHVPIVRTPFLYSVRLLPCTSEDAVTSQAEQSCASGMPCSRRRNAGSPCSPAKESPGRREIKCPVSCIFEKRGVAAISSPSWLTLFLLTRPEWYSWAYFVFRQLESSVAPQEAFLSITARRFQTRQSVRSLARAASSQML